MKPLPIIAIVLTLAAFAALAAPATAQYAKSPSPKFIEIRTDLAERPRFVVKPERER
jgi:hypothetical protein